MTDRPEPVPPLADLVPYAPPRHPAPVDLVLSGNEGDWPTPELLSGLAGREARVMRSYPSAADLERELAVRFGVDPTQVMVTAGGDETIDRLCRSFLAPGRRMVLPQPTFVMFAHYAQLARAEIDPVA